MRGLTEVIFALYKAAPSLQVKSMCRQSTAQFCSNISGSRHSEVKLIVGMSCDKTEMTPGDELATFGLLIFDLADNFTVFITLNRRLQPQLPSKSARRQLVAECQASHERDGE